MSQVLTPEEMAALFEELREAEDGPGSHYYHDYHASRKNPSNDRLFSESGRIHSFQNLSAWLMELADLRWPHL
jgi:hypothetical protein